MNEECTIRRVYDDGSFDLTWSDSGETVRAVLHGVRPIEPLPSLYREMLTTRVIATRRAPIAERRGAVGEHEIVRLLVFGWQDKSGDVWQDIGPVLLRDGLVTLAPGDFPERAEYEKVASDR